MPRLRSGLRDPDRQKTDDIMSVRFVDSIALDFTGILIYMVLKFLEQCHNHRDIRDRFHFYPAHDLSSNENPERHLYPRWRSR